MRPPPPSPALSREGRSTARSHTHTHTFHPPPPTPFPAWQVFPWVKLIASMREPISRYLSMLGHNLDKNTYTCLRK